MKKKKALGEKDDSSDNAKPFVKYFYHNINLLILLAVSLVLLILVVPASPERRGDSNEYYQTMISLGDHASPNLRNSDVDKYNKLRHEAAATSTSFAEDIANGINTGNGYVETTSGQQFSVHFWLYSLSAVPAKWCLQISGLNELKALQVTNALWVIFALALVLFYSGFGKYQKWLFTALILFNPAMWFLKWPTPEIFCYSLIVASIALFTRKSYYLAVLCAALASTQNPPIAFLMFYYLIYGFADVRSTRQFKKVPLLIASLLPALAPMFFNYIHFHVLNTIYEEGLASFSNISLSRTLSIFFDLNQGMLPFIPLVLFFFAFLLFRSWKRKERLIYELLLIVLLMVLMSQTTANLNSDTIGIIRYAVWMLPLFIWGIVEGLDFALKTDRVFLFTIVMVQIIIVFSFPIWFIARRDNPSQPGIFLQNNYLAGYLLDNHPYLYNPEPEIFTERTLHKEVDVEESLPVIYTRDDGYVTKILTNYQAMDKLDEYADLDTGFLQEQKDKHRGDKGLFYINLPPGEVKMKLSTSR